MKVAFIDNLLHKKTKSSLFFIELLNEKHDVITFWHDSWSGDNFIDIDKINDQNFDLIIFWQIILKPKHIQKLRCKNIIWIPMYDTEIVRPIYKIQTIGYLKFNIKIISFSRALTKKMEDLGFKVLTLQYYPAPKIKSRKKFENSNILFWQRIESINIELINQILPANNINKIIYKNNPDPNQNTKIPKQENLEIVDEWLSDEEYNKLLDNSNIFIAPRKYEGIGMSFLDAMAHGIVVISPNSPTANEYIKDNYNGYLYDIKNPQPIDLSNIKEVNKNLQKSFEEGYNDWQKDKEKIHDFIKPRGFEINIKYKFFYMLYKIYSPLLELMRKIKRLLKIKFY